MIFPGEYSYILVPTPPRGQGKVGLHQIELRWLIISLENFTENMCKRIGLRPTSSNAQFARKEAK
jgi:hypothetical protein